MTDRRLRAFNAWWAAPAVLPVLTGPMYPQQRVGDEPGAGGVLAAGGYLDFSDCSSVLVADGVAAS